MTSGTLTGLEIAVVGMAGRFPRAASVDVLWDALVAGRECISFFAAEALRAAGVDAALLADPNYVRAAGVVDGVELFDAAFFGYSPREAALLDPQQRMFLELAWTALEHAGYGPGTFDGAIGVYGGVGLNDYFLQHVHPAGARTRDEMAQVANDKDFLATRISYKLNLSGPSVVVQTACSTSLVAIHLACQSLIAGECDMALAGGVTIRLPQTTGYLFQEGGISSPDGHCRAFSSGAQGCVPGNGGALVVLKRLSDALDAGDTIHAVVKGSAINNDGARKIGYTAPGIDGQARVIQSALRVADTPADTIGYLEAHGTGTVLGDPIEIQAATQAYRQGTTRTQFCAIGSIKTNVGHLDAGAGVTGFIKAALAVKHGVVPPTLHYDTPNPNIDFARSPFYVSGSLREWDPSFAIRRAGVSSFGIGGTNAHVIVEEPPTATTSASPRRGHELLLVSAKTERALAQSAGELADFLRARRDVDLGDVAFTLRAGRAAMAHRRAIVCRDVDQAIARLSESAAQHATEPVVAPRVVFMFPGQGAQYASMGRELYESQPTFRRHVDAASDFVAPLIGVDLRAIITAQPTEALDRTLADTRIAQPAIFTVSYALAQLLREWGIEPAAMIGHSIGEYVAACLANVFSFEGALRLVCERGALMSAVAPGAMVAVALGADQLEPLLPRDVALAAVNAPNLSVVAGPTAATDDFIRQLRDREIEVRPLHTSHAFHSPMMDPVLGAFSARLQNVPLRVPAIPYISNVTGTWITPDAATDPAYWARHLRGVVFFSPGLEKILELPGAVLVEVGPGQTLTTLARRHRRDGGSGPLAIATMPRAEERGTNERVLLEALGALWTSGADVDWRRVPIGGGRRVPLPTYPFQRERFWLEPTTAAAAPATGKRSDPAEWFSVPTWERLPRRSTPYRTPPTTDASGRATRWIVFVDNHGLGDALARSLLTAGHDVATVRAGRSYGRLASDEFHIAPGNVDDYQRLCAELGALEQHALHVVHCWNVEPDDRVKRGRDHLADYQNRGFYSLMFLAQALGAQSDVRGCRVSVVSSQIHEVVGGETLCPEKATILGPCRVIPLEYDDIACCHIDVVLPAAGTAGRSALVASLLDTLVEPPDDVIAIRGGYRWRGVLAPAKLDRADTAPLVRTGGVYLITGGMGGLGLAVARHLWKTVQARLVLIGRTPVPPRADWDRLLRDDAVDAERALARLGDEAPSLVARVPVAPMSREDGCERALDRLSAAYVIEFLTRSGIATREPQAFDRSELARRCGVLPRFDRLFRQMLRMLEADGFVALDGDSVRFTGRDERLDVAELRAAAAARYPHLTPVFELLDNCAAHLDEALNGRAPAIERLFGDGHRDLFRRAVECVREHSHVPLCEEIVRTLVASIAAQERGRPLRILEIGGGDGLLTRSLLPLLAGRSVEYCFTDISRSFVVSAERFAADRGLSFMRFSTLDISKPPVPQGFAADSFDLVVAFNVLHATSRVAESVAHARELIAPGGLLVMQESVRPARWVDLVWGLTDGWWAFDDAPLRSSSPLLPLDAWCGVLRDRGFDLVSAFPTGIDGLDTGVIVGRKPAAARARPIAATPADSLVRQQLATIAELERDGAEIEVVAADVADAVAMRAAVDRALARFGSIDGVIHAALVLDDGPLQEKSRAAVERVFAPKVNGTLVLKDVCAGLDLDFFVIFSSLVSLLGGRGQVDYCAASNFQDAFAHAEQETLARSVVSINWGAWREIGKAFRSAVERGATTDEALPDGMSPAEGIDALMRVLASPYAQVAASPQNPIQLRNRDRASIDTRRSIVAAQPHVGAELAPPQGQVPGAEQARPLHVAERADMPRTETERVIADIWKDVLGVSRVGISDNFFDLGGDSVISLQFIAKAKKAGLRFTKGQVFEHQTVAELAAVASGNVNPGNANVEHR